MSIWMIIILYLILLGVDILLLIWKKITLEQSDQIVMLLDTGYMVALILLAAWRFAHGDVEKALGDLIAVAIIAVLWWKHNRRNRKRMAEKVSGAVTDLGHRLVVTPVPIKTES